MASGGAIRLAVVAPYPALRAGLRSMLEAEGLLVVRDVGAVEELLDGAPVTVMVVDAGASVDGAQLAAMAAEVSNIRPVVLGPVASAERLASMLEGRAWAYLPREAERSVLAAAVRAVVADLVAIDRSMTRDLSEAPGGPSVEGDPALEDLSRREREVLQLVAEGLANKMIASRLRISEHTVKFHVASILAKLGAASRTEASHLAARRGLISL